MDTPLETPQAKQEDRKPLEALHARFDALEAEARDRLWKALDAGQHRLSDLDEALERLAREDWSVEGMRKQFGALRVRGERLREKVLEKMNEMPASAVSALAGGMRSRVQRLVRELERLEKMVEPHAEKKAAGANGED
jgi:archaellum component FlaC